MSLKTTPAVSKHLESKLKNYAALSKALVLKPLKDPKKMMSLGIAFISGISAADAAIIYSGPQNVSCGLPAHSNRCYANIDLAGGNDFEIRRNNVGANVFIQADEVLGGGFSINGFNGAIAGAYAYPNANASGVVMGPAAAWVFGTGQANTLSELNNIYPGDKWTALANGTTRFIGIRGTIAGQTRYGWIRLTKNAFGNFTIVDWAYENTGAAISTGQIAILPISLLSFSGKELNGTASLNWSTASEINNAGFDIERSEDGINFKSVSWVAGAGTSDAKKEYVYDDKNLRSGKIFYYRLRQVNIDGTYKYSSIITVSTSHSASLFTGEFYPNPSNGKKVKLTYTAIENGTCDVEVFDIVGKKFHQQKVNLIKGENNLSFDFSVLSAGTYYVKMANNSNKIYRTLVIL